VNTWEALGRKQLEVVGCDGHLPSVEMARKPGDYSEVLHLRFPPLPFEDRSFDKVLIMEIVEHFP
jgi:hypothetical protein